MIYLDNAATTFPKPVSVRNAVAYALKKYGANPGRAGHSMSIASSEEVYRCRSEAAEFFHAPGPECVAFTLNCTHAINYVLKGMLSPGDHVVTSCLEHNAVMRPLHSLSGVEFTEAHVFPGNDDATVESFRQAIRNNTKLIVCTHASNVWGIRLPVEKIVRLGRKFGIPTAVDCAQSAGVLPVSMQEGPDFLCIAGHKGLYGPMGVGMLIAADGAKLSTIIEGGTGTKSAQMEQPDEMPERMESGTQNMPGIAGLRAGIEFVKKHEMFLIQFLYDRLFRMDGVRLYTERPEQNYFAPVLSFNVGDVPSEVIGRELSNGGIAVRAGLHCAPAAHIFMGTLEQGAVRVCPSIFSNLNEINGFLLALSKIIESHRIK